MSIRIAALIAATSATAAIGSAPTAHADEQAFLNDLQSQGVVMAPGEELEIGNHACVYLRAGASPDAASHYGHLRDQVNGTTRQIVDAAQRQLCPDTLH